MRRPTRRSALAVLPIGVVLAAAALPLFLMASRVSVLQEFDWTALSPTLGFALGGAAVATFAGAIAGAGAGMLALPGRRLLLVAACALAAAPPAFWWIGLTRLPGVAWGRTGGVWGGALVAGLALSPVTMLLVYAALRELPSNIYEAARVALPPGRRITAILLPLLGAPLVGGFLLTAILLLGESEIPFLFGFRTAMTDIVTEFSRTYDVAQVASRAAPLLLIVGGLAALAGRPLLRTLLASAQGGQGVVRRRVVSPAAFLVAVPAAAVALSLGGYAAAARYGAGWRGSESAAFLASLAEPVACAWLTLSIVVTAAYSARGAPAMRSCLWAGLLLFCVPAGIHAIGWIGVGQALGGVAIAPLVAHCSRAVGLPLVALAVAYSRLPRSLEDAARLVPMAPAHRALRLILPLLAPTLVAASALVAALAFADRDVASVLLPPGASRLMLDLYLVSANAPSARVAAAAFSAIVGGALAVGLAAAGPLVLWRRRG